MQAARPPRTRWTCLLGLAWGSLKVGKVTGQAWGWLKNKPKEKLIDAFGNLCLYSDEGVTPLKINKENMTLVLGIGGMENTACSCHPTWEFTKDQRFKTIKSSNLIQGED